MLALEQLLNGRIHDGGTNAEPLYRLVDGGSLVPQWIRPIDDRTLEVLFVEHQGNQGRAQLIPEYLPEDGSSAWLSDMHGHKLHELRPTNDGDGWNIPYQAGSILPVRWRYR